MAFRRVARSMTSAVSFVAERMRMPSYSSMRSRWSPSSTSKCSRSSATPEAPIFSATRTRITSRHPVDDPVDAGGERLHVGEVDRREEPDAQLVAPQLAIGLGVDDPVGAQRGGHRGGVDLVGEVDRAHDERALGRIGDERRGEVAVLRPAVEVAGVRARALHAAVEAAEAEHPVELVGEQEERRHRGRVVGLVLARVLQGGGQRERLGDPAVGGRQLADALDRGRAEQRQPQPAVGRRRTSGARSSRRRPAPRRPAARRRRSWRR